MEPEENENSQNMSMEHKKLGRPRKYDNPDDMQAAVDKYFQETPEDEQGVCSLALGLGFVSRQSFVDYKGYEKPFSDIIKKAVMRLAASREKWLKQCTPATIGSIFWLKNHGWSDQHTTEIKGIIGTRELSTDEMKLLLVDQVVDADDALPEV